jgi:hypothetical protein
VNGVLAEFNAQNATPFSHPSPSCYGNGWPEADWQL